MADPFDVTDTDSVPVSTPDNGASPDMWRNLLQFGLATMNAGAQPGATLFGSIGQGGLAAMDAARQNAQARVNTQLGQQNVIGAQLGNTQNLYKTILQNRFMGNIGMPTMQLPQIPGLQQQPSIQQPNNPTINGMPQAPPAQPQQTSQQNNGMGMNVPASALQMPTQGSQATQQNLNAMLANNGIASTIQNATQPQGMTAPAPMTSAGYTWSNTPGTANVQPQQRIEPASGQGGGIPNSQLGNYFSNPQMMGSVTDPNIARELASASAISGGLVNVPVKMADLGYAGPIAGQEANARLPADIQKINAEQAARYQTELALAGNKPVPGKAYVQPGETILGQDGKPLPVNTPYDTYVTPASMMGQGNGAAPQAGGASAGGQATNAQNATVSTTGPRVLPGINPQTQAAAEATGKDFAAFKKDLGEKAEAGPLTNDNLQSMLAAEQQFPTNTLGDLRNKVAGLSGAFKDAFDAVPSDELNNQIIGGATIQKLQGAVLRGVAASTFSRITNLDMITTAKSLPNETTPHQAMPVLVGQLQGANDYNIAANKLLGQYDGKADTNQALTYLQQRISPAAFMFLRYPSDTRQFVLSQMPQKDISNLQNQIKYIRNNGLGYDQISTGEPQQ